MSKDKRGAAKKAASNQPYPMGVIVVSALIALGGMMLILFILLQKRSAAAPIAITVAMLPTQASTATPIQRRELPPTFTPTASFTPAPTFTPRDTSTPYMSPTPPPMVLNTPVMSSQPDAIAYVQGRDIYAIDPVTWRSDLLIPDGADPLWSPDGRWIAFTRYIGRTDNVELCVVRADGRGEIQLTNTGIQNGSFRWLPNSAGMIFVNKVLVDDRGEYVDPPRLHLVLMDGTAPQTIGSDPIQRGSFTDYSISPNSNAVMYTSAVSHDLMKIDLTTNTETVVVNNDDTTLVMDFAWSPIETGFANVSGGGTSVPGLYSSMLPDFTRIDRNLAITPSVMQIVGWSSDSSIIYWTATDSSNTTWLYGTKPEGLNITKIFEIKLPANEVLVEKPRVSSNGTLIWASGVCSSGGQIADSKVSFYALLPGTQQSQQIATAESRATCSFGTQGRSFWDLAPDGTAIVYAISDAGSQDAGLHTVNVDGSNAQTLLSDREIYAPAWR